MPTETEIVQLKKEIHHLREYISGLKQENKEQSLRIGELESQLLNNKNRENQLIGNELLHSAHRCYCLWRLPRRHQPTATRLSTGAHPTPPCFAPTTEPSTCILPRTCAICLYIVRATLSTGSLLVPPSTSSRAPSGCPTVVYGHRASTA